MKEEDVVIVSRHVGAVEWLRQRGITGRVLPFATAKDVRDKIVIGNVPMFLASLAKKIYSIEFPDLPEEARGKELSAEEMENYGAKLFAYRVYRLGEYRDNGKDKKGE